MGWTGLSKKDFNARGVTERTSPSRQLNRCTVNHLPPLLLSSHRLITSPILRVFGQQTPIQLWRTQKSSVSTALGGNSAKTNVIQVQTRRAFGRSCRSSEYRSSQYSSGHQSTVAAAITSRTILDSISQSLLVLLAEFGRHALRQ